MNPTTYHPQNILITGGAGFIGAHFIDFLLTHETPRTIVNLDKLTYAGSLDRLKALPPHPGYQFVKGDIGDEQLVEALFRRYHIDTIVHFAAESHVDRSIASPDAFIETNILGTSTLLKVAERIWLQEKKYTATNCRFHHISTDEVFGSLRKEDAPVTENAPYRPRSPYAASKASADHLVFAYYHTYGLPITLSYCSNNYGPNQHQEKFIPTIIRACLKQQAIPLYGDGQNIREWLYVEDHCRGILSILTKGRVGESYNIGNQNNWTNVSLVNYLCQLLNRHAPIQFIEDRRGHDFRYALNTDKIQRELGFLPTISFEAGMQKTVAAYT